MCVCGKGEKVFESIRSCGWLICFGNEASAELSGR